LLPEHSFFRDYFDKMPLPPHWGSVRRVSGTILSLASDWSHINYGHYLLDALTRWHLFTAAGYSADDVQGIYCPAANAARGRWLAERLGIPGERCLMKPLERGEGLQADLLLAPTFPAFRCNYPDWIVGFLRGAVRPAAAATRRLYITRGQGRRALGNEDDLLPLLLQRDFEIYDPVRASDPPGDFAMAGTVVGAHGAGLADLAFCPRGARVLELIPSDHVHPYFCSLAQAAGLRYGYLVGTSLGERPPRTWGPSPFNFTVDPDELASALDATLGDVWPPSAPPLTALGL
jgi:capsular polysaccharide biosynthesis protein